MRLAASADVIVEGFRPGVVDKLGIGYQAVAAINPRIVYCAITGYGQDGPYRDRAGHDLNYLAYSGLLDQIGIAEQCASNSQLPDRRPARRLAERADRAARRRRRRPCQRSWPLRRRVDDRRRFRAHPLPATGRARPRARAAARRRPAFRRHAQLRCLCNQRRPPPGGQRDGAEVLADPVRHPLDRPELRPCAFATAPRGSASAANWKPSSPSAVSPSGPRFSMASTAAWRRSCGSRRVSKTSS
jgi:hypothetical protein